MTNIKTQIPPFSYVEVQNKLLIHSNAVETTPKSDNHNTCTVANLKINGYKVDKNMRLSDERWNLLTKEQKDAFLEKRNQLCMKQSFPSNQKNDKENYKDEEKQPSKCTNKQLEANSDKISSVSQSIEERQ